MVKASVLARYLVYSLLVVGELCSSHVANEGERKRSQVERRQSNPYIRIVQGLFRSDKIKPDAGEAQKFVEEFQKGQVPTIIQDLPQDVIRAFSTVVGIFLSLPTQIVNVAEAAVTDVVNVFNDIESGAIVSELEQIPGVIVSDFENTWGDLTPGFWDAACLIVNCPTTSTAADGSCSGTQATTTPASIQSSLLSSSSAIQPTSPPLSTIPSPTQTRPTSSSSPVVSSQLSSSTFGSSQTPVVSCWWLQNRQDHLTAEHFSIMLAIRIGFAWGHSLTIMNFIFTP